MGKTCLWKSHWMGEERYIRHSKEECSGWPWKEKLWNSWIKSKSLFLWVHSFRLCSSSLFMSGWSSISVGSLVVCSICPYFMARMLVSWNWMQWLKFILCLAIAYFFRCWAWYCGGTPWSWSQWNVQCFQTKVTLNKPKETGSLPRWEAYSLDVLNNVLLMQLKVVPKWRARRLLMLDPL